MLYRAIAVVALIVGLLAFAVLGPRWLTSGKPGDPSSAPTAECRVIQGPCEWQSDGVRWSVSLTRVGTASEGDRLRLEVVTDARPQRLLAVLRGESMYLGEYPVALRAVPAGAQSGAAAGTWTATFVAPFCTIEPDMTWRLDLQDGSEALTGAPFKLVFAASGEH